MQKKSFKTDNRVKQVKVMKKSWYEGNWNNKIHRKRMKNAKNSLKQKS